MRPTSSLFAPSRLTNSENVVLDCQIIAAAVSSAALHILNAPSSSPSEAVCSHTWPTSSAGSHNSRVNRSGRHVISEFPETLSPVILHFSDGRLCSQISLIRSHHRFFFFAFRQMLISAFSSRPRHIALYGQFPASSKAFPGHGQRFHKIAMTEN